MEDAFFKVMKVFALLGIGLCAGMSVDSHLFRDQDSVLVMVTKDEVWVHTHFLRAYPWRIIPANKAGCYALRIGGDKIEDVPDDWCKLTEKDIKPIR